MTGKSFHLVVKNGTVVSAHASYQADLGIRDGRIAAIAASGGLDADTAQVLDARGRYVLPGVIDGHVHFREPGLEYKEDFRTGSRSAVMGGVTTVLEMPNTLPIASTAERVMEKRRLAEVESIQRVGLFAAHTGTKVHIFHLSSRPGLEAISEWRAKGVDITCEAAPHHCFLTADDMHRLGPMLRINPPVREPGHANALLAGLAAGGVTSIATDHSPHLRAEKMHDDIWKAVSGFAGVEISLRLFLTYGVHAGRLTLPQLVRATSQGPARTWGLFPRKGAIAVGSDADLTIVDLDVEDRIEESRLHGKNNQTPFEGYATRGTAVATVIRGHVVMQEGNLISSPIGRMVQRL